MEDRYLTLSSRSFHSLLAFPPPLLPAGNRSPYKMTTYARPRPAPIDTLPVELLSHVFTLATHAAAEPLPSGGLSGDLDGAPAFDAESVKAPLVFASVSRYWRQVALNTPSLWTSLCITLELVRPPQNPSPSSAASTLDSRHITSYLALSRQHPIDILIDARDQDWDFQEEEITPDSCSYTPPFTVKHMESVVSLLLPHLPRWRSLNILTDTWKPMRSALQTINAAILRSGAPRLESLCLMRCNDFVSFSQEFEPKSLKDPYFLSSATPISSPHPGPLLPRLRHLSLRGVHVDWASLSESLSSSKTGLYSLELCSHCSDVRPSLSEMHNLLSSNPRLRSLVVSGSGPSGPTDLDEAVDTIHHEFDGVLLPHLSQLTVGYRSGLEGQMVLQLVNAPSLKSLVLEEATYPADPEVIDAGSLLTYLGTGEFHSVKERYLVAYDLLGGGQYQVKTRKDSTSSITTCVGGGIEIDGRLIDDDEDDMTLVDFDTKPHPPFPLLSSLSLRNVRSSSTQPMGAMFGALQSLKTLELVGMPVHPLYTLLPEPARFYPTGPSTSAEASSSSSLPQAQLRCPQLQSICVQDSTGQVKLEDLNFILNQFVTDRKAHGSCSLEDIEIQLGPNAPLASCGIKLQDGEVSTIGEVIDAQRPCSLEKSGVKVNIRRHPSAVENGGEQDDDMDSSSDGTLEDEDDSTPFDEGGAFNDPHFDAYYTSDSYLSGR